MIATFQGTIQDNIIMLDELRPFNGKTVTVIVNESPAPGGIDGTASRRMSFLEEHRKNRRPSTRTAEDIDAFIREGRDNDRF